MCSIFYALQRQVKMLAVSKMTVGSPIEKFKSVPCYTSFLAFCLLFIQRYRCKMRHQWISNMPYIQCGTSVYMQLSGNTYSDPSTLRHEHSSTIITVPLVYSSNSKLGCLCIRVLHYTSHNIVALHPYQK